LEHVEQKGGYINVTRNTKECEKFHSVMKRLCTKDEQKIPYFPRNSATSNFTSSQLCAQMEVYIQDILGIPSLYQASTTLRFFHIVKHKTKVKHVLLRINPLHMRL